MRHPSKMALLNKPTKVHQLFKKTTIFALLRRCQLDFRLFHFSTISCFLHALKPKIAVLRGRQLDFRVSHISKNRCFFYCANFGSGILSKATETGSSPESFAHFQLSSARISSLEFSFVQLRSAQLSSVQFSSLHFNSAELSSTSTRLDTTLIG